MRNTTDYILTENHIQLKGHWFWSKSKTLSSSEINSIRIETIQGFASDASIFTKDNSEIKLKLRWKTQLEELSQFAIKNQIKCYIEEIYHGGDIQSIYPN